MSSLLIYILQSSAVFAVLYILYIFLFRKLTFHAFNRLLLLVMMPISLLIPVMEWRWEGRLIGEINQQIPKVDSFFGTLDEAMLISDEVSAEPEIASSVLASSDWAMLDWLCFAYIIGLLFFASKVVFQLVSLFQMKRKAMGYKVGKYWVLLGDFPSAFSCFKWIFLPKSQELTQSEVMLAHEKAHLDLKHSTDLLFAQMFSAVMWFNPFVFFFQRSVKEVHEFQADAMVLGSGLKKSDYLQAMLQSVEGRLGGGLVSYFNAPLIQNRVKMITKNKSSFIQTFRYLLLVPVVILAIMAFSPKGEQTLATIPVGPIFQEGKFAFNPIEEPSIFPIEKGKYDKMSSGFGYRMHPVFNVKKFHTGVDFTAKIGTHVRATAKGKVTAVIDSDKGYGKHIVIDHGNGFETKYAQLNGFEVYEGQEVKRGQVIGYVGSSGTSTGPHLHYEVRKDGKALNPVHYLKDDDC